MTESDTWHYKQTRLQLVPSCILDTVTRVTTGNTEETIPPRVVGWYRHRKYEQVGQKS